MMTVVTSSCTPSLCFRIQQVGVGDPPPLGYRPYSSLAPVPPPPGCNSHMNNPRACSSSAQTEGNTAHPSSRQHEAKRSAVTTTLAGQELHRANLGGGDNYQCPQRVTRGTGRTRDLPLPEGSDMAGGGPCVSGVIPGGCRRSGGLCPRQATQGTNPGPGLCPPKRHTHPPNLVPGAGRACLPLRRAGPDPPVPGPRTRPVPPQEPGLSLVSPPRPPPVTETGPGVPHNRSEPTGTSGNAAFIPAPQTETRPSL